MDLSLWVLVFGILSGGLYSTVTCLTQSEETRDGPLVDVAMSAGLVRHHAGSLQVDEASVAVHNTLDRKFKIYSQYDMCYKCPLLYTGEVHANDNATFIYLTYSAVNISLTDGQEAGNITCSVHASLLQYGHYDLNISLNAANQTECDLLLQNNPMDANTPIYIAIVVLSVLAVLFGAGKYLYRRYSGYLRQYEEMLVQDPPVESDLGAAGSESIPETPPPKQRLQSLDTFRGLSLVIMIFVNYKGGKYWFFHHSAWNGITLADTVFPWFTFIMGTSIALAQRSRLRRGTTRRVLVWQVVKRSAILFMLGLMISNSGKRGGVDISKLRIPGVLQRLALSYFSVAMMEVFFAKAEDPPQDKWWRVVRDVVPFWGEWLIALSLLTIHLCLTFLLPVPGCPTGYIGPGGLGDNAAHVNCTGGAAGYIDRVVLGENHIYGHPTCTVLYQTTTPFDPEGILGTLTSIFMCFLGLQAGKVLLFFPSWQDRVRRWLIWAFITGVIAGILCKFSQNEGWIPVNKNLWSVSFVLALASMAFILLTVLYLIVDVVKLWGGAPFIFPGMNSIVVYLCSEVLQSYFPVQIQVPNTHAALLPMHMYGASVWTIMAAVMYYKDVFIAI